MLASSSGLMVGVDMLGWALLHFLWQGALVGVIYALARPFCSGVTTRYRLGIGLLALMLLCPFLTIAWLWPTADAGIAASSGALQSLGLQGFGDAVSAATGDVSSWHFEKLLPWLVAIWLCGVSLIATRTLLHWRRLNWLVKFASVPVPECQAMLARLCERFSISRPVRLLCSFKLASPIMIGWLKPVILLPASMLSGFSAHQIELIIAHELGHVRRWDYVLNLAQILVETVLFYHPVVHWISNDVRDSREACCDDLVLTLAQGSPLVYARALADLEQMRHDIPAAPALAANGGMLMMRIRRIVGVSAHAYEPLPRSSGWPAILALFAAVALALTRLHLAQQPVLAALAQVPAQTLALVSGNARLNSPVASVTAEEKRPVSTVAAPLVADATKTVLPGSPAAKVPVVSATPTAVSHPVAPVLDVPPSPSPLIEQVGRPHITVLASVAAPPRIDNIRAPMAAISVAELEPTHAVAAARPVPLRLVQPTYPERADLRRLTGEVQLEYSIAADGEVRDVRVVHADPPQVFDDSAVAALRQWRFAASAGLNPEQRYAQTFAFARASSQKPAAESCHEVIGSHICRRPGD